MPNINEYVNYSNQGICQVEDIRIIKFQSDSCERNYYVLNPIHQKNARIFVPTDNDNLIGKMRPILSPNEIDSIILSVHNCDMAWIDDQKQ